MVPSPPSTRSLRPVLSSVGPGGELGALAHDGVPVSSRKSESALASRLLEICSHINSPRVGSLLFPELRVASLIRRVCFPVERLTSRKVPVHQRKARAHQRQLFVFCFRSGFFAQDICMGPMIFLALRVQVDSLPVKAYSQVICLPMKNRNDLSCCKVR